MQLNVLTSEGTVEVASRLCKALPAKEAQYEFEHTVCPQAGITVLLSLQCDPQSNSAS